MHDERSGGMQNLGSSPDDQRGAQMTEAVPIPEVESRGTACISCELEESRLAGNIIKDSQPTEV